MFSKARTASGTVCVLMLLFLKSVYYPGGASGKEPSCLCGELKRCRLDPWVRKIPWRRAWQPTPVFLPGESHRQRSLTGYSPQGHKELDMTEGTQHSRAQHATQRRCWSPMQGSLGGMCDLVRGQQVGTPSIMAGQSLVQENLAGLVLWSLGR